MLHELHIRNLVVVENVHLKFHSGLNVLTGSTGAGKSLILGAVNLLLGHRASPELIRAGADRAEVSAVFSGPGTGTIHQSTVPTARVRVRREVRRGGRSYAYIGEDTVTVRQLGDFCAGWIEPHGQNEQFRLKNPESHVEYLDAFAGNVALRRSLEKELHAHQEATAALRGFDQRIALLREKRELLEHRVTELQRAAISAGERETLEKELRILSNAERIYETLGYACTALYDDDAAAATLVSQVTRKLGDIAGLDERIDAVTAQIEASGIALSEGVDALRTLMDRLEFDPVVLQRKQERLDHIYALEQRYGLGAEELISQGTAWSEELDGLAFASDDRVALQSKADECAAALGAAAAELSRSRRRAGAKIDRRMTQSLEELMLRGARFRTDITLDEDPESTVRVDGVSVLVSPRGADRVHMMVRTNPGGEEGGVDRIASSGEISRIALALKELTSMGSRGSVVIFDEIDAGVGADLGAVIAEKLLALADHHQIICITHMPQIAACADHHVVVTKESDSKQARVHVDTLGPEERRVEIARMLGGAHGSDHRTRLAAEMLRHNERQTKTNPSRP
ncbi:MAG: DNA repair protein RecN [Candidatus Krumholzibacteriota bacterium]|nr:DNA repair protein RecN [Candidatus Krumholzibacteriota bacterium]